MRETRMGASDEKNRCREAAFYYYELQDRNEAAVPESVRQHVAGCEFCQGRLRSLREMLSGSRDQNDQVSCRDDEMVETLRLHLDLMDQPITCACVKPLLPTLLVPPRIRIPTPVTVHVDRCPPCATDLAALRGLNLTPDQLHRLGRLYGAPSPPSGMECERARAGVAALGSLAFTDVPGEILDHVATCPLCRAEVCHRWEQLALVLGWHGTGAAAASCDALTTAQLFDLVVPYGLTRDQAREVRAASAHARTCPLCLEQAQGLHRTLYGIAARPDSEVITVYQVRDSPEGEPTGAEDTPARHPVRVQIVRRMPAARSSGTDPVPARSAADRPGRVRRNVKSLWKVALAAAAIVVAVALYAVHGPAASGTTAGEILRALEQAANVHIVTSGADVSEPVQEMWIARNLNRIATRTATRCVLYDLNAGRQRVIDTVSSEDQTTRLAPAQVQRVRRTMAEAVGAVLTRVSRGVRLVEIPAADSTGLSAPASVVYELTVTTRTYGSSTQRQRWRIVVDSGTGLPRRMESFRQQPPEDRWMPLTTRTFEYLSEQEIAEALRTLFPES